MSEYINELYAEAEPWLFRAAEFFVTTMFDDPAMLAWVFC
jgi:hypothetical protein